MNDAQGHNTIEDGRWYFYQAESGTWCWDVVDNEGEVVRRSNQWFQSRAACVLDARSHGYGIDAMAA